MYSQIPALCPGGGGIEKILLTDRTVPTLFKPIQRKYFFDREIEFVSISNVKVFFPTSMIKNKASGVEHKFCTALMEKTVGGIGILNSDLFSDQFFLQCRFLHGSSDKKMPRFSSSCSVDGKHSAGTRSVRFLPFFIPFTSGEFHSDLFL